MEEKLPSSTVGHRARVAVVTGAARGLGRAIAQGLAGAGASVFGVDLVHGQANLSTRMSEATALFELSVSDERSWLTPSGGAGGASPYIFI